MLITTKYSENLKKQNSLRYSYYNVMVHITAKHSPYDNHKSLQNLVQYPMAWQQSNQLDDTSVIRPKSSA